MKPEREIQLDFIIDRLTNSVRNTISGDSFQTEVGRLAQQDLKTVTKSKGWKFNWRVELSDNSKEVFKLTIMNNPTIIQGLVSYTVKTDHVFMNLLESAPFNLGKDKLYEGVAGNLVAHVCKTSFRLGFEGFVSFTAKTALIPHYQRAIGAVHFGNHLMIIPTPVAQQLVQQYFKS